MQTRRLLSKGNEMKAHEMPWHSWNDDDYYVIDRETDQLIGQIGCKAAGYENARKFIQSDDKVFFGLGLEVKSQYLNKK